LSPINKGIARIIAAWNNQVSPPFSLDVGHTGSFSDAKVIQPIIDALKNSNKVSELYFDNNDLRDSGNNSNVTYFYKLGLNAFLSQIGQHPILNKLDISR
jgi:hypothetical protein